MPPFSRGLKNNTHIVMKLLFVCLFWGLSSHSRIFHSYGDVTIADEGLQILTYARHSWSLSSEGSLACHNYCDTGHPYIMVISGDLWHSHSGTDPTWFYDLGLSWLGFENPTNKACEANSLIHRAIAAVCPIFKDNEFFHQLHSLSFCQWIHGYDCLYKLMVCL